MLTILLALVLSPFTTHTASAQTEVVVERPKFEVTGYGLVDRRRIPIYLCRSTGGQYLGPQAPAYRIDYVIESVYGRDVGKDGGKDVGKDGGENDQRVERMGRVKVGCYQVVETHNDGQPLTRANQTFAFESQLKFCNRTIKSDLFGENARLIERGGEFEGTNLILEKRQIRPWEPSNGYAYIEVNRKTGATVDFRLDLTVKEDGVKRFILTEGRHFKCEAMRSAQNP